MQAATATKGFTTGTFNYLSTKNVTREQQILEPDDDLRRAITGNELLERIYKDIDRKFENRIQ